MVLFLVPKDSLTPTSPEQNMSFSQLNTKYPTLSTTSMLDSPKTRERKLKQKKGKKRLCVLFF